MMRKKTIDKMLPFAYDFLNEKEKLREIESKSTIKGYASAFGAACIMSGYGAAAAFYEKDNNNSKEDKSLITKGILYIISKVRETEETYMSLFEYIKGKIEENNYIMPCEVKEEIENAVIALKLSLNLFNLEIKKNPRNR